MPRFATLDVTLIVHGMLGLFGLAIICFLKVFTFFLLLFLEKDDALLLEISLGKLELEFLTNTNGRTSKVMKDLLISSSTTTILFDVAAESIDDNDLGEDNAENLLKNFPGFDCHSFLVFSGSSAEVTAKVVV